MTRRPHVLMRCLSLAVTVANKSNKSNKSDGPSDLDELSLPGAVSSMLMAQAVNAAGSAVNRLNEASASSTAPATLGEPDYWRRLTPRHRTELIVQALIPGTEPQHNRNNSISVAGLTLTAPGNNSVFWKDQYISLRRRRHQRDERLAEIQLQQTDIISFVAQPVGIGADSHPWLMVLLDTVEIATFRIEAQVKAHFRMARPNAVALDLAPPIQTPTHSSYPSGHATESFALAQILGCCFPEHRSAIRVADARGAENRSYAGVHFPIDDLAGAHFAGKLGWKAGLECVLQRQF